MKKVLLTLVIAILAVITIGFAVSAETVTVVDDGIAEITLGECVIENLGRENPAPSVCFNMR